MYWHILYVLRNQMKFEKIIFFSIVNAGDNAQKSAQGFKNKISTKHKWRYSHYSTALFINKLINTF